MTISGRGEIRPVRHWRPSRQNRIDAGLYGKLLLLISEHLAYLLATRLVGSAQKP